MTTVFATLKNYGDGFSGICWFDGREVCIEELLELAEYDPETWAGGNGLQVDALVFPEGFNFDACGITFTDIEEIRLDRNS